MKLAKVFKTHKIPGATIIRLGIVLTILASLIGIMVASAAGETWVPLGGGMNADVYALLFDGSGSLVAAGGFTSAGGVAANRIARMERQRLESAWQRHERRNLRPCGRPKRKPVCRREFHQRRRGGGDAHCPVGRDHLDSPGQRHER